MHGRRQAAHHGVRVSVNRRFLDFLSGSIAYVYGTGTALEMNDSPLASDVLARDLVNYLHRSYYHALTSRVDARIPRTGTQVSTIVRWYPGTTLSPIDLFYDRKDTLTKGVNLFVRQAIPLPEFMGTPGRWEALVDLRNLFDQGRGVLRTRDGELSLTDAHRVGYATANRRCNCDSVANCISDVFTFTFAIAIGATFKGNHSKLGI